MEENRFIVVAGSYERILYGYDLPNSPSTKFSQRFLSAPHESCIKVVTAHVLDGIPYLFSTSTDETNK
jgi:hypothetical protein